MHPTPALKNLVHTVCRREGDGAFLEADKSSLWHRWCVIGDSVRQDAVHSWSYCAANDCGLMIMILVCGKMLMVLMIAC